MKETIKEFLARGGAISIVPKQEAENNETIHLIPNQDLLSLSHGRDLFGKRNKRKSQ